MDLHKNPRSVPASRALLFKRASEQGSSVRAALEAAGMSDRRGREWIRRARAAEPLTDRSSQPRTAKSIPAGVRATIVTLRRERRTMRQVAQIAGVSTSTVARICRAEGLSRLRSLESPPPPICYERERPGELLHLDTKRLGRFDRPGHRIRRKRSFGSLGQGFEFVFVATDDTSRLSFARNYRDERSDVAARFLNEAVDWFSRRQFVIEHVMTDNSSPFLGRAFRNACAALQIKHKRTRPYTPRTNGKVERFIQTLLREWAYRFEYASSTERKQWLAPYLHSYNYHRAHSSLGDNPPISRPDRKNVLRRNS